MNNFNSEKYGVPPEMVEKKSLGDKKSWEVYDFHRMVRVSRDVKRYKHNNIRFDKKMAKKLQSLLMIGEKVLVLDERLRKKDASEIYTKAQPKTFHFLTEKKYL